jgi:mannose-6-phosphate isomerase class I
VTIANWKDFIANWPTNVGDLFLIPPGTVHAHGGNQMVLEMDTCPSIAGTEYSFFLYDFARPTWDEKTKTMTARPCKMHLEHGFDNEKWVLASTSQKGLQARPRVVKWTQDYQFDRYTSDPRMPFEVERFHFDKWAENDTQGRFMHILTVTVGQRVTVRSLTDPSKQATILKFQSMVVPAAFGRYEMVNEDQGLCTVVLFRWKKGGR